MVPEPCQQVWVSYGGTGDHASVSWGALRLNECHPLRVLRIEKPTFSKQSNLSVLWAELPSLWKEITFFTCSCWVHTPVDRTKKLLMNMWNWLKKKIRLLNVCVRIYVWNSRRMKRMGKNQYFLSVPLCRTWGEDPPRGLRRPNGGIKKVRKIQFALTELSFGCARVHVCVCAWHTLKQKIIIPCERRHRSYFETQERNSRM